MLAQISKIIKYINQEIYDNYIKHLNLSTCKCACGAIGRFEKHAYYERSIKTNHGKLTLRILRVKCKSCNKTHAILHPSIIPYSQIVLSDTISIINCKLNYKSYFKSNDANPEMNEGDLYYTLNRFLKHWYERIKVLIADINQTIIEFLTNDNSIIKIFNTYKKTFMQIHRGYYYLIS